MSKPRSEDRPPEAPGRILRLSGQAVIELMRAVHARGLPFRFQAGGHSMAPLIREGDVLSVSPLSFRAPGKGDVVAFLHPDTRSLAVHRVLFRNRNAFLLQGDNMPGSPDGIVPREAILGRVTRVERGGRRIRLGLGPERVLLAFLIRKGLLAAIRRYAGPLCRPCGRRRLSCRKD